VPRHLCLIVCSVCACAVGAGTTFTDVEQVRFYVARNTKMALPPQPESRSPIEPRLQQMRDRVRARQHARLRQNSAPDVLDECEREALSWTRRVSRLLPRQCEAERPVILEHERIVFTRTVPGASPAHSSENWAAKFADGCAHELGPISNACADWKNALSQGWRGRRDVAAKGLATTRENTEKRELFEMATESIDAALCLARRCSPSSSSPSTRTATSFERIQPAARVADCRICNGGPITLELSDVLFRQSDGVRKVAMLVQAFARVGCQQLQLNTLHIETLHDAKRCPERHPGLIVRAWEWSGYFRELAPEYQDHIIARHVY